MNVAGQCKRNAFARIYIVHATKAIIFTESKKEKKQKEIKEKRRLNHVS